MGVEGGDLWLYHRPCLGRYGGHCMVGRLDRDHPAVVVARPQEGGVAGLRHRVSGHSGGQPVDIDTVGDLVEAD